MSMQEKLDQLNKLRQIVEAGGGQKRIDKQHESGKKTARERINELFDPGSFREIDVFAASEDDWIFNNKTPGEGVTCGYGTIAGRKVYIFAQDFTVVGGSLGRVHAAKICKTLDMAMKVGAPVIGICDSGGARIQEGVDALNGYGEIFYRNTIASGVIPQISVIMGPCAGGAVYSPALTDFIFMVSGTSQMFITGPLVIKATTGEDVSMEALGGAATHNQISGVAHFMANNEEECIAQIKALLSYLPSNNLEEPPTYAPVEPSVDKEILVDIVPTDPNKGYEVRDIINAVVDGGSFFEVHQYYATNGVVGFARINGQPVGIIANQPRILAGCLDINVSDKIARHIRFCDCFNLPIITFMDVPGFLPGVQQEYGGIIRHGAKMLYAYSEATVPKITIILRKAYGGAYLAMCANALRADMTFAWPTAEIAVMGPEGAVNVINRKELSEAENPIELRKKLVEDYRNRFANPYLASARGFIQDVIDPRDTREKIINALWNMSTKRETRPRKKHGNIPM
ncbi:MAG: methylmalonyl-CoA carboxyltransferase [Pelotomaculum sp.]|uniref:Methylmalonyl-CoA decarboxylase, alpha subunit n=1 Tax=Pelotomaculum thermopropionicum (strain DSM 13744 / JCM 10971 / SI) TaxID=370438 RepID=A5D2I9_PELTS|nr:methylmalonyl-CoA carboxyltransferase [Pelotomaculum sp.]BAF59545.1 methylmalonyl-CoA decarboxylase, alpha subunit [Pelotomaculum thermopropionicum SI]